jgi:pilus assembly protein Flp/PilA
MRHLRNKLWEFLTKEDGPTSVEYAVMLAFIIVVVFAAVQTVGLNSSSNFNSPKISNALSSGS